MATFIDSLTAVDIAAGVRAGEFSAVELARAALSAIDARESDVQAFLRSRLRWPLGAAARVDGRFAPPASPPAAADRRATGSIKDNMNMLGTRTTCASRMLENYESPYTATCVQRMLDAGCVLLGKANMDEFAFGSSTEARRFTVRTIHGTSSAFPAVSRGSAAAVALGMATLLPGIRIPAVRFASLQRFAAWLV